MSAVPKELTDAEFTQLVVLLQRLREGTQANTEQYVAVTPILVDLYRAELAALQLWNEAHP